MMQHRRPAYRVARPIRALEATMARSNLALVARTDDVFDGARVKLEDLIEELAGKDAGRLRAHDLEDLVTGKGAEVVRELLQAALKLRALREERRESVTGEDGVERNHVRRGTTRPLMTTVGRVEVERFAYSARGSDARMPLDAELSLPKYIYSHKVCRRIAEYAAEMSFEKARRFSDTMGAPIPQRQAEELAARAATDFEAFYASRPSTPATTDDLLVLSFDGKGIVMRKEALREATRKAAEARKPRLDKRRSKGEPAHLKRMAEVGAIYDVEPFIRTRYDVVFELHKKGPKPAKPKPRAQNKRLWASVEREQLNVIVEGFQEALRRDPEKKRRWIVLVDGNPEQLDTVKRCARYMGVGITIVFDVIHVLEYLWKAGLCFNDEGSKELEEWVEERFLNILDGRVGDVAGGIKRSATKRGLEKAERKNADACARYLLNHKEYMRYDEALKAGFPIATGVIEGACRSVVRDRMDITGARWGLKGAEAILKLRSLKASGDFDAYWDFHLEQEHKRVHEARYAPGEAPTPKDEPVLRVIRGGSSTSS
jgi:hypothetical protein